MRIQIFDNAKRDLVDGFAFYEAQSTGVGQYFLDSLYSDIDSLTLFAGIHPKKGSSWISVGLLAGMAEHGTVGG